MPIVMSSPTLPNLSVLSDSVKNLSLDDSAHSHFDDPLLKKGGFNFKSN